MNFRFAKLPCAVAVVGFLLAHAAVDADKPNRGAPGPVTAVEMFAAAEAGELEVQVIPKDATKATVLIRNKTDRPMRIRLPEAFAGVPVLAQRGGLVGGAGRNNANTGGGNQSFGGGMGMGGGMMGGGMGMGGFFHVPPDAVRKVKVATVCLEHGKPDPNPKVPYNLVPIEKFTKNQRVIEVCKMLGRGQVNQPIAQAAAWHLTNGLTWDELARKVKVRHLNGSTEMYFSPQHVMMAAGVVNVVTSRIEEGEEPSPGEVDVDDPADSLASTPTTK